MVWCKCSMVRSKFWLSWKEQSNLRSHFEIKTTFSVGKWWSKFNWNSILLRWTYYHTKAERKSMGKNIVCRCSIQVIGHLARFTRRVPNAARISRVLSVFLFCYSITRTENNELRTTTKQHFLKQIWLFYALPAICSFVYLPESTSHPNPSSDSFPLAYSSSIRRNTCIFCNRCWIGFLQFLKFE